jgi:hypothetical protein
MTMPKCGIAMQPCQSTQIKEFGYDAATKTLAVRFNGKAGEKTVYTYANVEPDLYDRMKESDSKGRFLGEHLKGRTKEHPFTKIVETDDEKAEAAS